MSNETESAQDFRRELYPMSVVMADAYLYIMFCGMVDDWKELAESGNTKAAEFIEGLRKVNSLCECLIEEHGD